MLVARRFGCRHGSPKPQAPFTAPPCLPTSPYYNHLVMCSQAPKFTSFLSDLELFWGKFQAQETLPGTIWHSFEPSRVIQFRNVVSASNIPKKLSRARIASDRRTLWNPAMVSTQFRSRSKPRRLARVTQWYRASLACLYVIRSMQYASSCLEHSLDRSAVIRGRYSAFWALCPAPPESDCSSPNPASAPRI